METDVRAEIESRLQRMEHTVTRCNNIFKRQMEKIRESMCKTPVQVALDENQTILIKHVYERIKAANELLELLEGDQQEKIRESAIELQNNSDEYMRYALFKILQSPKE